MTELNLFLLVFGLQIVLLSAYYPWRVWQRARYIVTHYPASTHPKLYPNSSRSFIRSMNWFNALHVINFTLGWVLVFLLHQGIWSVENGVNKLLPWGYFMLQMLPSVLWDVFGLKMAKLMQKADTRTIKSAQLTPRRLTDHIAPGLLTAVLLSYVAFLLIGYWVEGFEFSTNSKTTLMGGILLAGYALFWVMAKWLITGGGKNPYQSAAERHHAVATNIRTFAYTLIICCVFMLITLLIDTYEMEAIMPILMSVFLQLLVIVSMGIMLNKCRIENINFDVYKAG
ncbi:hypothetical protein [Marinicella meishanensis]|uniref:hypothetical protein n=1 Tax=Marinicella meishanensis TaxID=2873263 RepID=UPI001CBD22E7|nr:hypothetical protein [Marinicella sp. NBU2979]